MGETRVDLLHLLEDLRDAYPGSLEETILTEIVANSLDSGASTIAFSTDAAESTLTIIDNGSGMQRRDLVRYHDIAASTKTRGQGIGFAGVGIKLGLLACDDEAHPAFIRATNSRSEGYHIALSVALALARSPSKRPRNMASLPHSSPAGAAISNAQSTRNEVRCGIQGI
jgi:hypothetical protein